MAKGKEFKSLYLASKGIDNYGRALRDDEKVKEEAAKNEFNLALKEALAKCYAQIKLAKGAGWLDNDAADKLIEDVKGNSRKVVSYVDKIEKEINTALSKAGKEETFEAAE